jgi:hypothetical protein
MISYKLLYQGIHTVVVFMGKLVPIAAVISLSATVVANYSLRRPRQRADS